MKKIILFDMDGTLTPARQKMDINVEMRLSEAQKLGFEIGIITGSDMNYVEQQCSRLFDLSLVDTSKIHFLPCNGTKYILNRETIYERNMRDYMGETLWKRLMGLIIGLQNDLVLQYDFPLTGHFFDYRGSMLNWCPIGRNAGIEDREIWEKLNHENKIRSPMLKSLRKHIQQSINHYGDLAVADVELVAKYGGDTSIDIFPIGWDKTYPLEHTDIFDDYDKIYFIGDRTEPNGNDYEIFAHERTISFSTNSPDDTRDKIFAIIHNLI